MLEWALVGGGGALGALSRHAVNLAALRLLGSATLGVFFANVTGSFALGALVAYWETFSEAPDARRLFFAVGFLGSYTTFSTLAVAVTQGVEQGDYARALLNLLGSVAVGLAAAFAGLAVGRTIA